MSGALAGKVALVTGGARGIGRGIALALAEAGADVAIADAHPEPFRGERYYRLRARVSGADEEVPVAEALRTLGRRALTAALDVADAEAVARGVDEVTRALGPVDVLVNNAGVVNNIARIAEMTPDAWERELRVNLTGAFHTTRVVAPAMAKRGWGRVINISSVAAVTPGLGQPAYTASKAGLIAFTRATAQEFGRGGVTANAVMPGLIATPLVLSMPDALRARMLAQLPVARLGTPADIGALVAFLASPAAGFVTGAAIPCDGGLLGAALGGLDG